jgi:Uma2 family endonuclease
MADAKVGISEKGPFHYPDVMVTCDERESPTETLCERTARKIVQFPCLIAEVLSPGTEGFDRGKKFTHYRRLKTLKEYVLIDAEQMSVECYRLNAQNKWELTHYQIDETASEGTEPEVYLTSVDFRCPISLLYEDVDLSIESE